MSVERRLIWCKHTQLRWTTQAWHQANSVWPLCVFIVMWPLCILSVLCVSSMYSVSSMCSKCVICVLHVFHVFSMCPLYDLHVSSVWPPCVLYVLISSVSSMWPLCIIHLFSIWSCIPHVSLYVLHVAASKLKWSIQAELCPQCALRGTSEHCLFRLGCQDVKLWGHKMTS